MSRCRCWINYIIHSDIDLKLILTSNLLNSFMYVPVVAKDMAEIPEEDKHVKGKVQSQRREENRPGLLVC